MAGGVIRSVGAVGTKWIEAEAARQEGVFIWKR